MMLKPKIIGVATVLVAFYALGAFIAWNVNPGEWNALFRALVAGCAMFIAGGVLITV